MGLVRPIATQPTVSPEFSTDRGLMYSDNRRHLSLIFCPFSRGHEFDIVVRGSAANSRSCVLLLLWSVRQGHDVIAAAPLNQELELDLQVENPRVFIGFVSSKWRSRVYCPGLVRVVRALRDGIRNSLSQKVPERVAMTNRLMEHYAMMFLNRELLFPLKEAQIIIQQ